MIEHPPETFKSLSKPVRKKGRFWILSLSTLLGLASLGTIAAFQSRSVAAPPLAIVSPATVPVPYYADDTPNAPSVFGPPNTNSSQRFRPVIETRYVDQTYEVKVPYTDPTTGKASIRSETRTRKVPVKTTRMVVENRVMPVPVTGHEAPVLRLVQELKSMKEEGADSTQLKDKLADLREQLDAEFTRMHEQQATDIETTENRLAGLKKLHQQRGEKQEEIVQRRIDQLLGKPNPLDWNINAPADAYSAPTTMEPYYANPRGSNDLRQRTITALVPGPDDSSLESSRRLGRIPNSASTFKPLTYETNIDHDTLRDPERRSISARDPRDSAADSSQNLDPSDQPQSSNRNQIDFFVVIELSSCDLLDEGEVMHFLCRYERRRSV